MDGFKTRYIRLEDLVTAKEQGTEIHFVDILRIRSGYIASVYTKSASGAMAQPQNNENKRAIRIFVGNLSAKR